MANNVQSDMDTKPSKNLQPYLSQQFFNWVLTICVAFLFGKTCWSSEKASQQPYHGYGSQAVAPASAASPIIRQDSIYSKNLPVRSSSPGRMYIRGPRGGCYYISESGNKVYVDRRLCD